MRPKPMARHISKTLGVDMMQQLKTKFMALKTMSSISCLLANWKGNCMVRSFLDIR